MVNRKLLHTYMKKTLLFIIISVALFAACTPKANISGSIIDAKDKTIYLEHTGLTTTTLLDSTKLGNSNVVPLSSNSISATTRPSLSP